MMSGPRPRKFSHSDPPCGRTCGPNSSMRAHGYARHEPRYSDRKLAQRMDIVGAIHLAERLETPTREAGAKGYTHWS